MARATVAELRAAQGAAAVFTVDEAAGLLGADRADFLRWAESHRILRELPWGTRVCWLDVLDRIGARAADALPAQHTAQLPRRPPRGRET